MRYLFANRMMQVRESFIREVLKVTKDPSVISFAGGLPNPEIFPVKALADAAAKVFEQDGRAMLQYSTTEGYLPLQEFIARRYFKRYGLKIEPDNILITNGSQQALDLIGKIFLDKEDRVIMERPGYFGAIQSFAFYEPSFVGVPVDRDGIDLDRFEQAIQEQQPKLFYTVPNFQNPSGITYSAQKRQAVAGLLEQYGVIGIEDDPYGELRYVGQEQPAIKSYFDDGIILLGSFSKIVSPGARLGWVCANSEIMKKLLIAKQAADLHSNYLSQRIVCQYLQDNDLDSHLNQIRHVYKKQRDLMLAMIDRWLPGEVDYNEPEGGMFLWLRLPEGQSAFELFEYAAKLKVAFVPGEAFYLDGSGKNTLRLNFSNSDEARIETGVQRLAQALKSYLIERERKVVRV